MANPKRSTSLVAINPFAAQACIISGLKSARRRLQRVYFPGPISNLLSVLCVLMQTLSGVMRKRKQECFRIWNFTLLLVVFKWHHDSERVKRPMLCSAKIVPTSSYLQSDGRLVVYWSLWYAGTEVYSKMNPLFWIVESEVKFTYIQRPLL